MSCRSLSIWCLSMATLSLSALRSILSRHSPLSWANDSFMAWKGEGNSTLLAGLFNELLQMVTDLVEPEDLVLGLPLQVVESAVQLAVTVVDVADQVPGHSEQTELWLF